MHHVDQISIIVTLVLHVIHAQFKSKEFTSVRKHRHNHTLPFDARSKTLNFHLLTELNRVPPMPKSKKSRRQNRSKRGLFELYNTMVCATGCDPLLYQGYGCYCGFLGDGIPVDPIDRCCQIHDQCYDSANCPPFSEYVVSYSWTCHRGRVICGPTKRCGRRLCECDRMFTECLRRFPCPRRRPICTTAWRPFQAFLITGG